MKQSLRTPSVSVHYLSIIANALRRMGYVQRDIEQRTEALSEDEFYLQRVPVETLFAIWQQAERVSQDPLIALHVGERIHPMDYGLLGQLMMNCNTIQEAVERILSLEFVLNNAFASQVIVEGEWAINRIFCDQYDAETMRHVAEQDIAALINIGVFVMNRDYSDENRPLEVHFRHSPKGDISEYQRALRCPVKFNQQYSQVIYPKAILDAPIYNPSPRVAELLKAELKSLIEKIETQDSLSVRMWRFFQTQETANLPDIERTAQHFNMTSRTLQRHLKQEHTSFQDEIRQFKAILAKNLLNDRNQPIAQAAYLLGFQDLSAFHKAFKRWTGQTPGEYQKSLL